MERWDIQQLQSPLLKHLLSSHISLRTRRYRLAPADALQIAGCSSCIVIESFPSYSPTDNPPAHVGPPSFPTSTDAPAGPTSHRSAPISINSNEAGSGFPIIPNNAASPLPRRHTPAKMAGTPCGTDGRTDRQADRHAAM